MTSDPSQHRRDSTDGEPPRLVGRRVALRGFREDDFEALFALHSDATGGVRERWRVGGEVCDSAWHGLLAHDWRARRASVSRPGP